MNVSMHGPETPADEVIRLMRTRGGEAYFGEPVSQLEHALQAAWLATQANSAPSLIVAALLHDIGHLLHDLPENVAAGGIDTYHEEAGYQWLLSRFGPEVAEPVRAHVAAKRYLCKVDPEYFAQLSPASGEVPNLEPSNLRAMSRRYQARMVSGFATQATC
jgi:predicted HD phosphohydrolase